MSGNSDELSDTFVLLGHLREVVSLCALFSQDDKLLIPSMFFSFCTLFLKIFVKVHLLPKFAWASLL